MPSRVKAEHIKEAAQNLTGYNISKFFPRIKCPVLVLRAPGGMTTSDKIRLPEDALDKLLREMPDLKYRKIQASSH
ncbi:hypothetical protein D1BOALGB6SA_4527 [Olavius sp. associated proteobacterium Delta 1]|nr:hypothetical protein D1BOALGB6SA_4527 [Olavius sp. associated proteobacterium Delta 1]